MHDVANKGLRHTLAAAGMAASLVFLLASMWANYRYGSSLARTPEDGYIYGSAAAACDVLMAASPFFFSAARRNRNYTQMLGAGGVWLVMTAVAAVSAISQTSSNRIDAISARVTKSTSYSDTRAEITKARADLGFIPQHRPADTVKADIQGAKSKALWTSSSECSDPTGKAAREFCQAYFKLNAELGAATQAAKLDERIAELIAKSDKAAEANPSVAAEADAGAKSLSVISGLDVRSVQSGIVTLIAVMFLVGAGLGPSISWSVMETPKSKPDKRVAVTIEGEVLPPMPPDAIKAEAPKPQLALPKPEAPIPLRAEPSPEWRALLDAVDFPRKKPGMREPKRAQDAREHVLGLRWMTWIAAYDRTGTFSAADIERLYSEFVAADSREPWGINVAKAELRTMGKKWVTVRDSRPPTTWTIERPKLAHVRDMLLKRQAALERAGSWKGLAGNDAKGTTEPVEVRSGPVWLRGVFGKTASSG